MKVVVGDNVGVNGGASGEYELAPIGGDDGVAVAGLGEGERWYGTGHGVKRWRMEGSVDARMSMEEAPESAKRLWGVMDTDASTR